MNKKALHTYEEAIEILTSDASSKDLLKVSYLDANPKEAWERFIRSEEFFEISKLLSLSNGRKLKILDLGAGNGIASFAFLSLGHEVVSVDPNTGLRVGIGALKKSLKSSICVASYGEVLPFRDLTFDVVYSRQTLHHLLDLKKGLKEISRVLVKGGIFLASRDHVISNEEELSTFLNTHPLQKLHGGEFAYTKEAYRDAIREAGLSIKREFSPFDSVINHFPVSNDEIKKWLIDGLSRRVGASLASFLSRISIIEKLYRTKLSKEIATPGRLYSWLCRKEAS